MKSIKRGISVLLMEIGLAMLLSALLWGAGGGLSAQVATAVDANVEAPSPRRRLWMVHDKRHQFHTVRAGLRYAGGRHSEL